MDRTYVRETLESLVADGDAVLQALAEAYERGWQPADVMHITRKSLGVAEVRLAAWAILYDARLHPNSDRAPKRWLNQVRALAEQFSDPAGFGSTPLQRSSVVRLWRRLPRLTAELPPPSRWHEGFEERADRGGADPKLLARIRGLLAKAESTEFAEEAETFTAKAQELMSKHAVSAVLLRADASDSETTVDSRRIHLHSPYVKEKAQLLAEVADANRVRTVFFTKLAMATAVGTPTDLDQVELLFTSLLIQATRAMHSAAGGIDASSTTSFRRAFLYGFAVRIGQRLSAADSQATMQAAAESALSVSDVLPVLSSQLADVDAEFSRLFPNTTPMRTGTIDPSGWLAGRAAADRATFGEDSGYRPATGIAG
ncbi:DUF2786 domain-containing protein [Skermania sp. ID1734]|uniref:DUF2786 domain-containing protein n=1 Tax=Skermania sp. ID1734 TaxID=2597516 RepID=UPI00117E36AD|nr:DUF2786 domain-containing protein [Skermania sp. ID1734]TSD99738.1 DUF2786 domain-containing protein [Skermania sp. ID1734]